MWIEDDEFRGYINALRGIERKARIIEEYLGQEIMTKERAKIKILAKIMHGIRSKKGVNGPKELVEVLLKYRKGGSKNTK